MLKIKGLRHVQNAFSGPPENGPLGLFVQNTWDSDNRQCLQGFRECRREVSHVILHIWSDVGQNHVSQGPDLVPTGQSRAFSTQGKSR